MCLCVKLALITSCLVTSCMCSPPIAFGLDCYMQAQSCAFVPSTGTDSRCQTGLYLCSAPQVLRLAAAQGMTGGLRHPGLDRSQLELLGHKVRLHQQHRLHVIQGQDLLGESSHQGTPHSCWHHDLPTAGSTVGKAGCPIDEGSPVVATPCNTDFSSG